MTSVALYRKFHCSVLLMVCQYCVYSFFLTSILIQISVVSNVRLTILIISGLCIGTFRNIFIEVWHASSDYLFELSAPSFVTRNYHALATKCISGYRQSHWVTITGVESRNSLIEHVPCYWN